MATIILGIVAMPRFKPPLTLRPEAAPPSPKTGSEASPCTIGDLARDFGLTLRALRFYESKGMLQPRRRGLTRLYSAADRARLAAILNGKQLGLSLREIRDMLARGADAPGGEVSEGRVSGGTTLRLSETEVADRIAALEAQKHDIERAIAGLRGHRGGPSRARRRNAA